MQIDWGWGACLCTRAHTHTHTHTSTRGGMGRLNSHTLPMSHSLSLCTHTRINTHSYGQKDGGWRVATTCLTLSRLSATVTPTKADPSLFLLSCSPLYSEKWSFGWSLFGISCFAFSFVPLTAPWTLESSLSSAV